MLFRPIHSSSRHLAFRVYARVSSLSIVTLQRRVRGDWINLYPIHFILSVRCTRVAIAALCNRSHRHSSAADNNLRDLEFVVMLSEVYDLIRTPYMRVDWRVMLTDTIVASNYLASLERI